MSQNRQNKAYRESSFWLSLFLHLMLLLWFVGLFSHRVVDNEKNPEMYIPSYMASIESPPVPPVQAMPTPPVVKPTPVVKQTPISNNGIEKPVAKSKPTPPQQAQTVEQQTRQFQPMSVASQEQQGIHLLGEEKVDKSLRTILGKAIAQHLYYPRSAIEFNVKGTVLVGFTLHPDGQVTGVQLVKSSNAGILNSAALSAITEMSPVDGVYEYVPEPRYLVVGIIFN